MDSRFPERHQCAKVENSNSSPLSVSIDSFGAVPHRHDFAVLGNHRIGIHLGFHLTKLALAKSFFQTFTCLLVEEHDNPSLMVMDFRTVSKQTFDRLFLDAALLHPGCGVLSQLVHSYCPLFRSDCQFNKISSSWNGPLSSDYLICIECANFRGWFTIWATGYAIVAAWGISH